jgi:hypothetical protein
LQPKSSATNPAGAAIFRRRARFVICRKEAQKEDAQEKAQEDVEADSLAAPAAG